MNKPLAIMVIGASGDLARRKIMPSLFSLFARDLLPSRFAVFGFARSELDDNAFRARLEGSLACRYTPQKDCAALQKEFLERCHYVQGEYDQVSDFLNLYHAIRTEFPDEHPNCMYYLAVPPSVFMDCARALGESGMAQCGDKSPFWARAVVEKPFGHDRASSDELVKGLGRVLAEDDIYRIDHYLGKEIIQNLLVLRFANSFLEPLWNHRTIERVEIDWRETAGVERRTSYFNRYGIIRDVVQNHLLQVAALLGMERPADRSPDRVRAAKVALLRAIQPVQAADVRLGQYSAGQLAGLMRHGYLDESGIPADSITPTYVEATLKIDNPRWKDVPFVIRAGKAMDANLTEIRVIFRKPDYPWIDPDSSSPPANMLVIRVQPDEAIRLRLLTKIPGLTQKTTVKDLQLVYGETFSQTIPDAYERLLLDVIQGDKSLFISKDELEISWDIFTPLLHYIEQHKPEPEYYAFGSSDL